jgi:hypothetical protein
MSQASYREIIFLSDSAADDALAMLDTLGAAYTANHLAAEFEPRREPPIALEPFGAPSDDFAELGDYVLSWNGKLNYIGLAKKGG